MSRPLVEKTDVRVGGLRLFGRVFFGRPVYRTLTDVTFADYVVPAGFETDFVSAPAIVRWALPLKAMCLAAILHDFLRKVRLEVPLWKTNTRFLEELYVQDVPEPFRTLAWLAVRTNHNRV